jgi:hypothetical protein
MQPVIFSQNFFMFAIFLIVFGKLLFFLKKKKLDSHLLLIKSVRFGFINKKKKKKKTKTPSTNTLSILQ